MPKTKTKAATKAKSSPSKNTDTAKAKSGNKKVGAGAGRPVIYPEIKAHVRVGKNAITVDDMKTLLGWKVVDGKKEVYKDARGQALPTFYDMEGNEVVCLNNIANRVFSRSWCLTLAHDILNRNYEITGETLVFGKTGISVSAQHRGIALIFASQMWASDKDAYPKWDTEPVLESIVVMGIDETDKVINKIDTGRPRSFFDVLYRSEYFADMKADSRKICAKIADWAIRLLWERTGAFNNMEAPRRTHATTEDFLQNHEKILKAVRFIYKIDDTDDAVIGSEIISLGYAAACLYLMGTSSSDVKEYRDSKFPNEGMLDFANWEKAEDFWADVSQNERKTIAVKNAIAKLAKPDADGNTRDAVPHKLAVIAKAWHAYVEDEVPDSKSLSLKFDVDPEDGTASFAENPTFGGIDLGIAGWHDESEDPSPEELKKRAAAEKKKHAAEKRDKGEYDVGDTVYVMEDGNVLVCTVEEIDATDKGIRKVKLKSGKTASWYNPKVVLTENPEELEDEEEDEDESEESADGDYDDVDTTDEDAEDEESEDEDEEDEDEDDEE